MDRKIVYDLLKNSFKDNFEIVEVKNDLYQIFAPLYHSDGDMIDVFVRIKENNKLEICDCGLTLMRLSYDYELDTERKKFIFNTILKENNIINDRDNLILETKPEFLFQNILSMTMAICKISNMSLYQRDVINRLFYEQIGDFIVSDLERYQPKSDFNPIPNRDELIVDYCFSGGKQQKPVFLFAIKGADKAKTAVISMLSFQKEHIPFVGAVVYDDFSGLSSKDQKLVMSAADKQFYDIQDFKKNAALFMERSFAL